MKKPTSKLRVRGLDQRGLEKAQGGRGICHGYYECNFCHTVTTYKWEYCPTCGRFFTSGHGAAIP